MPPASRNSTRNAAARAAGQIALARFPWATPVVNITANMMRMEMAPTYTSTCTTARNSALRSTKIIATPRRLPTKPSAALNTLCACTITSAPPTVGMARPQKIASSMSVPKGFC